MSLPFLNTAPARTSATKWCRAEDRRVSGEFWRPRRSVPVGDGAGRVRLAVASAVAHGAALDGAHEVDDLAARQELGGEGERPAVGDHRRRCRAAVEGPQGD